MGLKQLSSKQEEEKPEKILGEVQTIKSLEEQHAITAL